jgi:hypothetical protein
MSGGKARRYKSGEHPFWRCGGLRYLRDMSRIPPKMKQTAAKKAKVYYMLPVSEGGNTYSMEVVISENPRTSEHFLKAVDATGKILWKTSVYRFVYNPDLEGDVQDVFVVDLFVDRDEVVVELEYNGIYRFDRTSGRVIKKS